MKFKIVPSENNYELNYLVYYKRGFFSKWQKIGLKRGYMELNECMRVIKEFKRVNEELKEINEELGNKKRLNQEQLRIKKAIQDMRCRRV